MNFAIVLLVEYAVKMCNLCWVEMKKSLENSAQQNRETFIQMNMGSKSLVSEMLGFS